MTVTPASLTALEASARKRSADVEARIDRALKKMRKQGLDINVSSLARHAGVSRSVIHRRPNCENRSAPPSRWPPPPIHRHHRLPTPRAASSPRYGPA
ncbi:Tn554 transposase C [Mycolicibacterium fortuitum]|uniref:Tn554 transposase C n=1 Tax=Mycolicibacterium fortuitum TaxID=1766 RepID=A0A378UZD5_MYCFO|nr:Tn554 transposase C [Mycolicibacterium fortuitum]